MEDKAIISLKEIAVDYDGERVLNGIDLDIHDKEFVTFLGPSGCGKTTTLRIIGGFVEATEGDVFFDGKRINDLPPHKRRVNTVFQKYALFPHLNVYENIEFGLKIKNVPESERGERIREMLELVGLLGFETRGINQLSGGQQQRVAIARALVNQPEVLLLDDFIISYFVSGPTSQTLPITIFSMTRRKVSPEVNALSSIIFVVVLAVLIAVNISDARREKQQRRLMMGGGRKVA